MPDECGNAQYRYLINKTEKDKKPPLSLCLSFRYPSKIQDRNQSDLAKLVMTPSLSGLIIPHILSCMVKQICPALLTWAFSPYMAFVSYVYSELVQRIASSYMPEIQFSKPMLKPAWSLLVHNQMGRITLPGN